MLDITTVSGKQRRRPPSATDVIDAIRAACARELPPLVQKIDKEGFYPESVMRELGRLALLRIICRTAATKIPISARPSRLWRRRASIVCRPRSACGARTRSPGTSSPPRTSRSKRASVRVLRCGEALGGTALSNPMKTFFGIEAIRLKGKRVDGGYVVKGLLPFVSNLGDDHYFGAIFEVDEPERLVMAIVPCASAGLTLAANTKFVALDGTRTFSVQLRDVFVPDA